MYLSTENKSINLFKLYLSFENIGKYVAIQAVYIPFSSYSLIVVVVVGASSIDTNVRKRTWPQ